MNITKLRKAINFAYAAHLGQEDKNGEPYILHPLRVMGQMRTPEEMAVAVLHDVVEDCEVSVLEIESMFGTTIAAAVAAISRIKGETYFDYVQRCSRNRLAAKVKLADIADNSRPDRQFPGHERALTERYPKAIAILTAALNGESTP